MTATMQPRVTATSTLLPSPPAYGVRGKIARQVVIVRACEALLVGIGQNG